MRPHDDDFLGVLRDGFTFDTGADIFHGTDRVRAGVRFSDWALTWDLDAAVKASGYGTVVHRSVSGESLVPDGVDGELSPYRARLLVYITIRARNFSRRVQLGWFPIEKVPEAWDTFARVGRRTRGRRHVMTSTVRTQLMSMDDRVRTAGFESPVQPPAGATGFGELRRIGLLPVRETVTDFTLPSGMTWEARQGGRLDAVHEIGRVHNLVPVVDWAGMWTLTPEEPAETPLATLEIGEHGTVIDIGHMVDTEGVYNEVFGVFETEQGDPIIVPPARITSGPLSVDGPWGRHSTYFSSPLVRTPEQARATLDSVLALMSGSQLYDIPITCVLNPLIEIGDTVDVTGHTRPLRGLVRQVRMNGGPTMDLILRVKRPLS